MTRWIIELILYINLFLKPPSVITLSLRHHIKNNTCYHFCIPPEAYSQCCYYYVEMEVYQLKLSLLTISSIPIHSMTAAAADCWVDGLIWERERERAIVIDIIVERKKSTHNENNGNAHTKIKEVENHIRKKSTSLWLLAKFGSFAIFRELDFN